MFSLSLFPRKFLISIFISSVTVGYLEICCLISTCLCFLQFFSCNWYLVWALWSEKILNMILIFLNLLRFDLWPKMWVDLSWRMFHVHLRRWMECPAFGWNVLMISVRSVSSNVSFKTCVSLLIFCFDDLSIGVSGVLKSATIIVLLSISPFISVSVCLIYWGAPLLGA